MTSTIKNIIIFVVIAAALILAYIFFFEQAPAQNNLTSSSGNPALPSGNVAASTASSQDFLSVLLNVKSIQLNDDIFSDSAFTSLHNTSIDLTPDGTEGRPNPFAPLGSDITAAPINALNTPAPAPVAPAPAAQTPTNITPTPTQ